MNAPGIASWRPGAWQVTVTAPDGREWSYRVIGGTDRPSLGWFIGTPWSFYPGSDWAEADGTQEPAVWTVPVFPESAKAALELDIDWPAAK